MIVYIFNHFLTVKIIQNSQELKISLHETRILELTKAESMKESNTNYSMQSD